ncbi:recombinase family protein [Paracidovorax citrulli]|uniref:Resolvase, N-terminal domain protein n=2 Tax=Paracidovorax citrulli TaxID=80869 RepID=A1TPT6_PARC0|nr:recombinase family protein [Paracidovorax citrulli]ABM32974.1 Resolvase, N-terminal domain protein [Paracidovorax citrulli AAC00-1]ATG93062.1 resolvase [Paracidovorax citrulli]PVY67198.1 DNA invertase Pin-like site-specific DNA recombinase [Paracidovorax citrulli]REG68641.1 DNA invertase Pin-like site-specific DNA recombinase [Paracidovorax citrulli]RLJ93196.1 DNA invertase Pin-like site-specific DNA recombinase [Paracidovorax citrulli]
MSRLVGYARVSTREQETAMQLAALRAAGVGVVYEEQASAVRQRPVWEQCLAALKRGDVLVVYKLDRLARSTSHFVTTFDLLRARGVGFRSLTEAIETVTPQGRMYLQLLAVFAEFERELIRERCVAGQRAARAAGKTWGRKAQLTREEVALAVQAWRSGWYTQEVLAAMLGVPVGTLRYHVHRHEGRGRHGAWSTDK